MSHKVTDETRKAVENASGMGLSQEDIACLLGVRDPKTVRRRYRKELDSGRMKANLQVATRLFEKCKAGDNTAIIWWEKTRAGKSDRLQLSTQPGNPLEIAHIAAEPDNIGKYYERLAQIARDRAAGRPAKPLAGAGIPEDLDGEGSGED